jgi:hypothetical protein
VVLWLINCAYSTPSDYKTQHPDRNLKYKKPLLETAGYWSVLQVLDGDSAREDEEEVERAETPLPPNMICLGDFRVTCGSMLETVVGSRRKVPSKTFAGYVLHTTEVWTQDTGADFVRFLL